MKRESPDTTWLRVGAAGATPQRDGVAESLSRGAPQTVQPSLWAHLVARGLAFASRRGRPAGRDSTAALPPHIVKDIGAGDALRAAERAYCESQAERFLRASAQLGGSSERFGPW